MTEPIRTLLACSALTLLAACGGGAGQGAKSETAMSETARLGELIFKDPSLSASGQLACISCHAPETGHAAANALPAQFGGAAMDLQGQRIAPSIRYLEQNSAFHFDAEGTPTGGFFLDGRAGSLQEQAAQPLLAEREMANRNAEEVAQKLARASYAERFRQQFGADILSRPDDALARIALALQAYQREAVEFHPYDSRYDAFLRGQASLNPQELRGLGLFNAPAKGNCAACHPSARRPDGGMPLFTDFSYDNLGLPRNPALRQNDDQAYFDLGLCGPSRQDLATRSDLCGAFKVPSLRNVALRKAFFHNGRFSTLKEALTFYVQRDTAPERWYPLKADGLVDKFNDLPAAYRANVNTSEAPYNRRAGAAPALSDSEIDDLIAFLSTLTDGYRP
jgi:cytochrome c peroxidase